MLYLDLLDKRIRSAQPLPCGHWLEEGLGSNLGIKDALSAALARQNKMQILKSVEEIRKRMEGVADLYHRLILVVGPSQSGKTTTLHGFASEAGYPVVNLGLELARRLLDLTERQRVLQLPVLLAEVVAESGGATVLLDLSQGL